METGKEGLTEFMFIGHFAIGFAAKRFAPQTSLGALLSAPLFLDMLWPVFVLAGWGQVRIDPGNTRFTPMDFAYYPWSHGLFMSVVWASGFALIYHTIAHYWPGTVAIWISVVSHWVLETSGRGTFRAAGAPTSESMREMSLRTPLLCCA